MDDNGDELQELQEGGSGNGTAPTLGGKIHSAAKNGFDKMKKRGKQSLKAMWKALPVKAKLIIIAVVAGIIGIILLCAMAWYLINLDINIADPNETYNSTTLSWEQIDLTADEWKLTETEIEAFIKSSNKSNDFLMQALLNRKSEIASWQNQYGYSAAFLISVAYQELENEPVDVNNITSILNKVDDFLLKMDVNGRLWNYREHKVFKIIAEEYVGEQRANEWANDIINRMTTNLASIGKYINSQEIQGTGDGYVGTFKNRTGKTFYNYKQITGSYVGYIWLSGDNNTIKKNGCALTSAATIISGYLGVKKNPQMIVQEQAQNGSYFTYAPNPQSYLQYYGINTSRPYYHNYTELSWQQKQMIINNLKAGRPVMIFVLGRDGIQDEKGIYHYGISQFTNSQHWMALLDYNESNNTIYVSNPSNTGGTGWIDSQVVLTSCTEFILVNN